VASEINSANRILKPSCNGAAVNESGFSYQSAAYAGLLQMTAYWKADASSKYRDFRSETAPLVVDLDGTLLRTDLTLESALRLIKQKPWIALLIPFWLLQGRAYLKRKIFQLVRIDASVLPLHEELLTWLRDEKARGRRLVLATASDYYAACSVVEPLALFDSVLGSDQHFNLKGRHKLETIL
jgi:hypothetical protein